MAVVFTGHDSQKLDVFQKWHRYFRPIYAIVWVRNQQGISIIFGGFDQSGYHQRRRSEVALPEFRYELCRAE